MHFSRRRFIKTAGLSGAFLAARFHGLPTWAQSAKPSAPCLLHTGSGYAPFIENFLGRIQPGSDEYITETYAAAIEVHLDAWSASLRNSPHDLHFIQNVIPPSLNASSLNNVNVKTLRSGPPIESEQAVFSGHGQMSGAVFMDSLREYLKPFLKIETVELQIDGLEVIAENPLRIATQVHYDLLGAIEGDRREERTGTWELTWRRKSENNWILEGWLASSELRSRLTGPGFVDITEACFNGAPSYEHQMWRSVDYWRTVLDGASGIDLYGNNGIAAGDFDGDGFDDLYVCQPAGLSNRLYRNRGDATFDDVTEKAGVGVIDGTSSALFVDLNNSGHQDLVVVRTSGPLLFVNRGDGTFELKPDAFHFARPPQGTFTAAAVADYDRDGLLDIYFCLYSYYQGISEYQFPQPYYDAQNGPPNFLLKNHGNYSFEDVTIPSGMDQNNNRFSFACGWNDFNNDGWPDLYVVNDFGRKNLYRNNGNGTFADVSAEAGVEDPGAGMSVCWFDYDRDGFDDLYVANMWSAAGKRVSSQNFFLLSAPEDVRRVYQKHANGNSLFHNDGGKGTFRDVTDDSGTRIGRWSWSSDAWDFDHDGYPDLYVTNGFVSGPETNNLSSFFWRQVVARSRTAGGNSKDYADAWSAINEFVRSDYSWSGYQRNNFYLNNRNGTFTEAAGILSLDFIDDSRSFVLADLDHDGRLEVVLKNRTAPQVRILHNELSLLGPSISFSLRGVKSNRDAVGAVIEVQTSDGRQRNSVRAGSGYLSQHSKTVIFGLGAIQTPVHATVHWPNGTMQTFENLPIGHCIHIEEGASTFTSVPFAASPRHSPTTATADRSALPVVFETWLAEPILPPDFKLQDQHSEMRSLSDDRSQPQILVVWRLGCSESDDQLKSLERLWPEWKRNKMNLLALGITPVPPGPSSRLEIETGSFSFPMLIADEKTATIYNIFHRYLFERRHDMTLPTTFLLDSDGAVVKVYNGFVDGSRIQSDYHSIPVGVEARLKRALPFPGTYFGKGLHHNYFTYGVAFLQHGFIDQALASFQQSIERNPSYAPAYYNLGLIHLNKYEIDDARANIEKAVGLDPSNADAWNNLGVVYGEKEDYVRAQQCFEKAVSLQPAHLLAIQNLVKLYQYQKHPEEAQQLLEKAVAAEPSAADLHVEFAMFLVGQNDLNQAKEHFDAAVQLQPRNTDALNGLGVVLMRLGDTHNAMDRFNQCKALAPEFDRPYLNIAALYMNTGDTERAHRILSEYLAGHPDNADVKDALKEIDKSR